MGACSIKEAFYISSPERQADQGLLQHLSPPLLREVLIYIFLPKEGANFRRVCIIEALWYTHSDTILYSDILLITLLDTIVISSDDEMDEYKGDGNISDKNNLRLKEFIFC